MSLEGSTVVVTGGSGGIGQGICQSFSAEGAHLASIDIREGDETAALCGDRLRAYTADVSSAVEVAQVFREIDEDFGPIEVLCNVAAIFPDVPFLDMSVEEFDRVMAVNIRGPFLCSQEAARRMRRHGRGRIINVTSTEAVQAWAGQSAYGASKSALRHLTMGMAVELAADGILVNAVGPGAVETAPTLAGFAASPRLAEHDLERTPLGRWGQPADIAAAVKFLACDASWMTGQTIYVDGGFLAAGLPVLRERNIPD